jgi:hypothetical protein
VWITPTDIKSTLSKSKKKSQIYEPGCKLGTLNHEFIPKNKPNLGQLF